MPGSPTGAFGLWSLHAPSFTHMDWQKSFTESLVGSTWSGQEEGHVASRAKEALSFISWPQGRWRTEPSLGVLLFAVATLRVLLGLEVLQKLS